jgi:hypothetical protein
MVGGAFPKDGDRRSVAKLYVALAHMPQLLKLREAVPALIEWLAEERARRLRFLQYYHGGRVLWEDEKPSRRESWLKQARLELGLEAP